VPHSEPLVRLGAVSYLNTRPLVEGLDRRPGVALRFDVPARCADLVEAGEVDLGLVPIIEYARHDDYAVVPGISIASTDAVDSVALFTRQPIERVRSIALDVSSRTSAGLVRVLCARYFGIQPAFVDAAPDIRAMLAQADAALLIGDPALFQDPASVDAVKIDLGLAWRAMTGLPFVWAVWAGRAGAATPETCRLSTPSPAASSRTIRPVRRVSRATSASRSPTGSTSRCWPARRRTSTRWRARG
jgi:chorismate dehydratase